jgi:hypothetical protein
MALTVFAEKMGFFHKGSAGFGVAPLDVCLSPPPGPVPIPYTNVLYAKDLIKGSKTVRIDGEPTFLEDYSETSTSIGDEGGTLGGSVITGVILGKGYFMVWSMTVHIEGLGVCRHGDMMGQNSASSPPSAIDAAAVSKPKAVTAAVPTPVAQQRAAEAKVLQATGPGDSKPVEQKPCDFEKVAIECKHTGKRGFGPFEFTYDGQIRDNLPRPKDRRKAFQPNIQVVAGTRDDKAETLKIKLGGGPGYGCSKKHPKISITNRATGEKTTHEGKTNVEFKAKCFPLPPPAHAAMSPAAIIGYFWFPPGATTRYFVEVESCGVLASLGKGFRKLSRQIDVFSSDEYKLSIEIPNPIGRNYEKAGTGPRKFPLVEHIPPAKPAGPSGSRWNKETAYNKELDATSPYRGAKPIDRAIVEIASTVTFTRNSEDLKVSESLGKLVRAIAEVENNIQSVMNFIKDLQPTVGWKFSFGIGFFKGSMDLEWAAKEGPDHTVFCWWKFTPSLTLLSLELEAEFGVDVVVLLVFKITLVLFGKGSGEIKLETPIEATPEKPSVEFSVGAEISIDLGIKAALGADWAAATGKITFAWPFEAKPKIDPKDGFGIYWKLDHKGIAANLVGNIKFVGSFSKKAVWMPPGTIGQGRFPDAGTKPTGVPAPGGQVGKAGK